MFYIISTFRSLRNPFARVSSLSQLPFRCRRFILLAKTKSAIFVSYGGSKGSCKLLRWTRLNLTFRKSDISINLNFNSVSAEEAIMTFTLSSDRSSFILKRSQKCPSQHKNSRKLCTEKEKPLLNIRGSQWKLIKQQNWVFQWREHHCRTNTKIRRKK